MSATNAVKLRVHHDIENDYPFTVELKLTKESSREVINYLRQLNFEYFVGILERDILGSFVITYYSRICFEFWDHNGSLISLLFRFAEKENAILFRLRF